MATLAVLLGFLLDANKNDEGPLKNSNELSSEPRIWLMKNAKIS
jgi:hypothetical protein